MLCYYCVWFVQVQAATEKFVAQIQSRRPTTLQGSSLDFSKPRLVQINVTDVGACMPMTSMVQPPPHPMAECCVFAAVPSTELAVIPCSGSDRQGNAASFEPQSEGGQLRQSLRVLFEVC